MTVTLVLPEQLAADLLHAAEADVETACVLLARQVETPAGNVRLLARALHWVPDEAYRRRNATALTITSDGYVPALAAAEADESVPIWLHTHPGNNSSPKPSKHDHLVDQQLADLFRAPCREPTIRCGCHCSVGRAALLHGSRRIRHLASRHRPPLGNWRAFRAHPKLATRHRATSGAVRPEQSGPSEVISNRVLSNLHIAVVGCGGTGSAVIEQLVRLGVRHLKLFDPDTLTAGNVTRVYGSFIHDVGAPKVDVNAAHVRRIAPDAEVLTAQAKVTVESTAKLLLDADVVFGCTDDNAGRLVLSRLASYLLTPVIDCGVLLSSGPRGRLLGIDGRVTVLAPGAACLVCRKPHRPTASDR